MNRRQFIQTAAVGSASMMPSAWAMEAHSQTKNAVRSNPPMWEEHDSLDLAGHTKICDFTADDDSPCVAYEDLRSRDGVITIVSRATHVKRFTTTTEEVFSTASSPYFGRSLKEVSKAGEDLLALHLLQGGADPDPEMVKNAIPPLTGCAVGLVSNPRDIWNTIVGTKECEDAMPIYPGGNTRNYFPVQHHPTFDQANVERRWEGMLNGWLPAVRKVLPLADGGYFEVLVFAEVDSVKPHITDTWHRTSLIRNGAVVERSYGFSYPNFPPFRMGPPETECYRALLRFAGYWERLTENTTKTQLPGQWYDIAKHSFVKELISRPDGSYPRYGAVDEDYASPVYDGFQDTFTTALYANLEWGRLEMARTVFDEFYSDFVDDRGLIDMRGPEVGQYGLTLSVIARYFQYSKDDSLLKKHRAKIEATAKILLDLHDQSLALPASSAGHGLIHGWSESDSCLWSDPKAYWQPYYSNSAFAARGLHDIAAVWKSMAPGGSAVGAEWEARSLALRKRTVESIRDNVRHNLNPPYIGPLPGARSTFQESQYNEKPNIQQWSHRIYSELLQADILPPDLANLTIDCLKANGGTTAGVVADIWPILPEGRKILGFISYGYAQMLLRLDRIEEFLLFMYSHRYHEHTRGSWTAMETRHIGATTNLFCLPAQQSLPLLIRWMLVMEDSDSDRLYLAKGVPREWLSGKEAIGITDAWTRFGKVSFTMKLSTNRELNASVHLEKKALPTELHLKVRLPKPLQLREISVNDKKLSDIGRFEGETIIIRTSGNSVFEIVARAVSL